MKSERRMVIHEKPIMMGGKKESFDAQSMAPSVATSVGGTGGDGLSRGQRRRRDKKEAWQRKFDFAGYMRDQMERRDLGALDLAGLTKEISSLPTSGPGEESAGGPKGSSQPTSRKKREELKKQEYTKFNQVLQFQPFQQNPFGALQQHLRNSIAVQTKEESQGKGGGQGQGQTQRKNSKQPDGPTAMED
uniref:Ribosome biogenesis protein SLX9 n=1 Tax=Chromera velia CCMP2878 TaxID=1169474 RepID=A0A0G4I124_9ALVE|eukprot:Cvel_13.t1-p1 / transcript=Cvel_13.t1 / gene=Cvel_13 / organism=Chromera_velia_CCMP2878 / gene_product=Putative ribosome biogenesis protein slx9-like, putative / transcript_product=Putative ribosome biogenesis protein slx9-like, putative / location=Cvel_scaffold5:88483-89203(-) / protein_length=189 / sequence_SO=supercontig / SO=protein_coding / is_pseudo=false